MPILMTYILMVIKDLSLHGEYIVKIMISYLYWTMVWALTYKQIECDKNEILVRFIDQLNIKTVHDITEIPNYITYISSFMLLWSLNNWYTVYSITTQTDKKLARPFHDDTKIETFWRGLIFLLIVEMNPLLVTWITADRLMLSMCAHFSRWAKNNWLLKRFKIKLLKYVYKIEHM